MYGQVYVKSLSSFVYFAVLNKLCMDSTLNCVLTVAVTVPHSTLCNQTDWVFMTRMWILRTVWLIFALWTGVLSHRIYLLII